jgi:hypothetical protein
LVSFLSNRAAAHYELGLFRNVVKDVNEAISLDSKCLRAHLWKAKALFSLGKRADAILAVRAGLDATGGWGDVVLLQELKHIESQCEADKTVATDAKAPPSQQAQQTQQPHGGNPNKCARATRFFTPLFFKQGLVETVLCRTRSTASLKRIWCNLEWAIRRSTS